MPTVDKSQFTSFSLTNTTRIGRDSSCELFLDNLRVSRLHCRLKRTAEGILLEDLSRNGTYSKGKRIQESIILKDGDTFQVGLTTFQLVGNTLRQQQNSGVVVSVANLTQVGVADGSLLRRVLRPDSGRKTILQNVSFVVQPGELVSIIGGSGAGKSTLLKALAGFRQAASGSVLFNDIDFYANRMALCTAVGYVPQEEVVHRELFVEEALRFSALLRLPSDTTPQEIERRIREVLKDLRLSHRRDASIATLSGGERKRLSIAIELISQPGLLLMDEPTSGLSPDFEIEFTHLLKNLKGTTTQRGGHTILMTTHSERLMMASDRIIVLAQGGKLAFAGKRDAALRYFGVNSFAEVMHLINSSRSPAEWESAFRQSHYYEAVPQQYLKGMGRPQSDKVDNIAAQMNAIKGKANFLKQFVTLSNRHLRVLLADPSNLLLLFIQPVLAAILFLLISPESVFDRVGLGAPPGILKAPLMLLVLILLVILFGLINASKELIREQAIFRQERMFQLRVSPYLLSKTAYLWVTSLVQCMILLCLIDPIRPLNVPNHGTLSLLCLMMLTSACAAQLGLLISALSTTPEQSLSSVALVFIPMLLLSGGVSTLPPHVEIFARYTPSYWAYGEMGHLYELNKLFQDLELPIQKNSMFEQTLPGWEALLIFSSLFYLLTLFCIHMRERKLFTAPS